MVLAIIGAINYNKFLKNNALKNETKKLASDIKYTITLAKSTSYPSNYKLGDAINLNNLPACNDRTWAIYSYDNTNYQKKKEHTIKTDITIDITKTNWPTSTAVFKVIDTDTGGLPTAAITIKQGANQYILVANSSGNIFTAANTTFYITLQNSLGRYNTITISPSGNVKITYYDKNGSVLSNEN